MAKNVLTDRFSEPLNGARTATIDIHAGDGNLTVDRLVTGDPVLASGSLQYFEKQGLPIRNRASTNGQATLSLKGREMGRPWIRFPWAACNGATEWQVHLNSTVLSDIKAHSDGGNIHLDLVSLTVASVCADTGGGNVVVLLPDNTANLSVETQTGAGNVTVELGHDITGSSLVNASSGAGNVVVCLPRGAAACIHAVHGLGKAIVDPQFCQVDPNTYQSPDFDDALNQIEVWAKSGAGNVIVSIR